MTASAPRPRDWFAAYRSPKALAGRALKDAAAASRAGRPPSQAALVRAIAAVIEDRDRGQAQADAAMYGQGRKDGLKLAAAWLANEGQRCRAEGKGRTAQTLDMAAKALGWHPSDPPLAHQLGNWRERDPISGG
jgi:hypothetical protein